MLDTLSPTQAIPTAHAPAVTVRGLQVRYGAVEAVRGIDLDVRRGEILALLGPNGAGKTSTIEVLEGFRAASGGSVEVLDADPWRAPRAWRDRIGIVLQESAPELGLTVRECLRLYAGYYSAPRDADDTIELVGLAEQAGTEATKLSGGQRRRLDVALALVGDPELIFLDEPTTGFDPAARRAAWEVVTGLRALGKTILLTTHYMEEAERLADRIVVMAQGARRRLRHARDAGRARPRRRRRHVHAPARRRTTPRSGSSATPTAASRCAPSGRWPTCTS